MRMMKLNGYDLPLSERLLVSLHNLCATSTQMAVKSDELARILQTDINEINQNLERHVSEGYVAAFQDQEGNRRFYLTNTGIIRVCSIFS
jgi:DNA-binding MarR family transcriptional regulator